MNRLTKVLSIADFYFFPPLNQSNSSSRKNISIFKVIQFRSPSSISAEEVNHKSTKWCCIHHYNQQTEGAMPGEYGNTVCALQHPTWAFPNIFYDFCDVRPNVVIKKNNMVMFLLVLWIFYRIVQPKRINCNKSASCYCVLLRSSSRCLFNSLPSIFFLCCSKRDLSSAMKSQFLMYHIPYMI